jgi:hypothetical protein
MKIGIVGSEAAKFTPETEAKAKEEIANLIEEGLYEDDEIPYIVSGECHLGGIDIWAKDIALDCNVGYIGFPPKSHSWSGGYKERNLQIANESDMVVCITVKKLPDGYTGMKFNKCYHCNTNTHVKSGGCWTVKQAIKMGKKGRVIVVE